MVNNYSNILVLLQSKIDESINNLSGSKIKSPNDYILEQAAAEMLRRYSSEDYSNQNYDGCNRYIYR
jgi:hypothetical protein